MRFGQHGKLNPKYVGPLEILDRIGLVAYKFALPSQLFGIHNVFHISMLREYEPNSSHVNSLELIVVGEDLSFVEKSLRIFDHKEQVLRTKMNPLVQVQWTFHTLEEATWERKANIRKRYPHLFT